jgi:hypothetical protein
MGNGIKSVSDPAGFVQSFLDSAKQWLSVARAAK